MIEILYLARKFWKPLVLIVVAGLLVNFGYGIARRACDAANLNAEITEIKRQSDAAESILAAANKDLAMRDAEILNLTKKVDDYELNIGKQNSCLLSRDDTERLRAIR